MQVTQEDPLKGTVRKASAPLTVASDAFWHKADLVKQAERILALDERVEGGAMFELSM